MPSDVPPDSTLGERFRAIRAATESLASPLSPEDATAQSMPDASPAKWHLAHTTWFFETFVLERCEPGFRPFDPGFRDLFNSYYVAVGEPFPRPRRGQVTRPGLQEVRAYRAEIDRRLGLLLDRASLPPESLAVVELGLHHEQQHQELLLTDLKHLLSLHPQRPAYGSRSAPRAAAPPLRWHAHAEGVRRIGHEAGGFCFDNEGPRHRVFLEPFEIASRPVTNGEYAAFLDEGGYRRPELWLSDGWATRDVEGWEAPLYWEHRDGRWWQFTLAGMREIRAEEPVCHVSYYEADAYARWAGARLPTEAEWETAAEGAPVEGHFLEAGILHPAAARGEGLAQLFGDVWEWTASAYLPYPGYRPAEGALGEYNGKFMCNQMVLRGGSCATPASHIRATYRNFFHPHCRWQFMGIRLAREAR